MKLFEQSYRAFGTIGRLSLEHCPEDVTKAIEEMDRTGKSVESILGAVKTSKGEFALYYR